jgi:hypothetical protein
MESWGVLFLGVIAASSLVQAAFLVGLARAGQKLARRVEDLQQRVDQDLRPGLENLMRVTRSLAVISDVAAAQTQRIGDVLSGALDRVEGTLDLVQKTVLRPLGPLSDLMALLKGLRHGVEVYRQLGSVQREHRGTARRYQDDEHLFI